MRILNSSDVRAALPMGECINAMKQAYLAVVNGSADVPLRTRIQIPKQTAVSLFMPAYVSQPEKDALSIKIVSLFPDNPNRGLSFIQASVLLLDPKTGKTLAILEGSSLTAIRTGAGGGAAADLLARPEIQVLAVFGAGVQARTQLEAICTVRDIKKVWLYDPDRAKMASMMSEMKGRVPIPVDIRLAENPTQATREADIICCATTSPTPVFLDEDLKPGVHINAIGSYTPDMQEIPSATMARALVVVDSKSASISESGDLIKPIQEGFFTEQQIHAELGQLVEGSKVGRSDDTQITLFKSVGLGVQDALAAQLVLENAEKMNLGTFVDF